MLSSWISCIPGMFKLGNYQNSENIISKATGITFAAFLDTAQKIADSASKSKGLAISSLLLTLQGLTIFSAFLKTPQNLKIRRAKVSKRTKVFDSAEFNCVPLSIHSSYIRSTGSLKEMPFQRKTHLLLKMPFQRPTFYTEMPFPIYTFYYRCPFKDPSLIHHPLSCPGSSSDLGVCLTRVVMR